MAEASAAFVLSNSVANPYARYLGGALSHDAFHATSIHPGTDQVRWCTRSCSTARQSVAQVRR